MPPSSPNFSPTGRVRQFVFPRNFDLKEIECASAASVIRPTNPKARHQFEQAVRDGHEIVISSIVLHELTFGVSRSKHPQRSSAALNSFLSGVSVLDFTADDAVSSAHIRANLTGRAMSSGPFDKLIAGQALRRNLILVTGNVREFSRVKHLDVVNWSH